MKLAVLDLGTNTFHLLIVEVGKDGSMTRIFKSKIAVKLGEGSIQKKIIGPVPFARGIRTLKHYASVIRKHHPEKVYAFATSGIRSAMNGNEFVAVAKKETGIKINVIPGEKEAQLICYGVRQCVNLGSKPHLIMDIGGGSTEFIIASDKKIFWKKSFDIGASRLLAAFKPSNPVTSSEVKRIEKYLSKILVPLELAIKEIPVEELIGSSGSFDTLAEMIGWKFHNRNVLKNVNAFGFDLKEYVELHERLLKSTTAQRMRMKGLIKMRVDMIVIASICTNYILKTFRIEKMTVSKFALKEGAVWEIINKNKSGNRY